MACLVVILLLGTVWFQQATKSKTRPTEPAIPIAETLRAEPPDSRYPVKGVRFPEFDAQGDLKREFKAGGLSPLDASHVEATNITITTYGTNREADVEIHLEQGTYDRHSGVAKSDSSVRIQRTNITISGTGMELDTKAEKATILGDVKVVLEDTRGQMPFNKESSTNN